MNIRFGSLALLLFVCPKIVCAKGDTQATARCKIRKVTPQDCDALINLYKSVSGVPGGLARTPPEITPDYISNLISRGIENGLFLVAIDDNKIIGAMVKYKPNVECFRHILYEGSILVGPPYQGRGIGTQLITSFLEAIKLSRPDVLRVELVVRESNTKAIALYEKLGFEKEGRFKHRIFNHLGNFEDDIPMTWINPAFSATSRSAPKN